jgi:hypothetical protein
VCAYSWLLSQGEADYNGKYRTWHKERVQIAKQQFDKVNELINRWFENYNNGM